MRHLFQTTIHVLLATLLCAGLATAQRQRPERAERPLPEARQELRERLRQRLEAVRARGPERTETRRGRPEARAEGRGLHRERQAGPREPRIHPRRAAALRRALLQPHRGPASHRGELRHQPGHRLDEVRLLRLERAVLRLQRLLEAERGGPRRTRRGA